MKRFHLLPLLLLIFTTSCNDRTLRTFTANVPVYMSYEELRAPVSVSAGRELAKPGKIYFKGSTMFVNEYREGIHVVDLTDPSDPKMAAFIEIPGNVDMAIRDNLLYADSYVDLVIIDITDPASPAGSDRVEGLFEYILPEYDYNYPLDEIDEDKGVVTGFVVREITREIQQHHYPWPVFYGYEDASPLSQATGGTSSGHSYGVGGSMARFLTHEEYLYALESNYMLKTIRLPEGEKPVVENEQYLWGNIETIFITGGYMYIGSSNGMHILDLREPSAPLKLSTYQHVTACDPVVVDGDLAYVTLRAGNACGGDLNLLEVIDISDKYNPERMASFSMTGPYGLGISGGILYVCEGEHGLKVFDATDPHHITDHLIASFDHVHAYDVIALPDLLFLTGDDGFLIYDTADRENITLLSHFPVANPHDQAQEP